MWLTIEDFKKPWLFFRAPLGWCQKPAQDTLRIFDKNPHTDPRTTPYYKVSVMMLSRGKWWHGVRTREDCVKQVQRLRTLRWSIAKNGIREPITMIIKNDGKMVVRDGYHRLFCADYVGYKKAIMVVKVMGPNFKAIEKLMLALGKGKRYTYHPLNNPNSALYHPYFRNWKAWRADTPARYRAILAKLGGAKTVLDIGSCEGYFSINLAAKGYDVTAIELNPNRAKILKFFANLRGFKIPVAVEDWRSYCARTEKEFDAAIFLSTFHHQVIHGGLGEFQKLGLIKAKKLFFEMCNKEPKMAKFALTNNEVVRRVLENTKFTHWEKIYTGQTAFLRDIYMFW